MLNKEIGHAAFADKIAPIKYGKFALDSSSNEIATVIRKKK